ncbi:MAG TPA: YcxB family protein [Thermoanaerobaculia bacterium]|nr:YcxB family protein [Thermoanaerobaculia bacterium]
MRIEYDITPEDWAAFGEYHARTSPQFRRATRVGVMNGMLILLLAGTAMSLAMHSIAWLALGLCGAAVWGWYWPRQVEANTRSYMAGKDLPCLRGRHVIEALPEGLRAKCDVTESLVAWVGVRGVIQTPEHVFVMLDRLQGYVIPKKLVVSGELEPFTREVERLAST